MSRVELYVERRGAGPRLVLSHGFGGSARNFRPQLKAFQSTHEVLAYDTRGHARSPAPAGSAEYEETELVQDLLRLVEASGPPLILGGLSLGAYTALRAALRAPEQIRGLVLASFPATEPGSRRSAWALGFAQAIESEGLESAGERYVWGPSSRFDEGARAFIRRGLLEHAPHALSAILRNVLAKVPEPDELEPELRAFERPTLVIVGGEDTPARAPCQRLAELLPNAELAVIPNAGHVVNLAAPDEFNRVLERFIARL